jgi:hypothetical protein
MKILIKKEDNVVFDFDNDIVYAKGGAADGGLQECSQEEATHIWNRDKNMACMNNGEIILIEVDNIPEEVKAEKYKYENGNFIINENYIEYHSEQERIAALEDMVNMLLLGGQN